MSWVSVVGGGLLLVVGGLVLVLVGATLQDKRDRKRFHQDDLP